MEEIGDNIVKIKWKYRILLGVLTGTLHMGLLALFEYFMDGAISSYYSLLFQGVFFAFFMCIGFPFFSEKFARKLGIKPGFQIIPDLEPDEEIAVQGPANLFRGFEGVGGKVFLTNKKIIFKSHKLNIQRGQTDIPYNDVKQVLKRKTGNIVDNGIRVITVSGKEHDFVLNDRDLWFDKLSKRLS